MNQSEVIPTCERACVKRAVERYRDKLAALKFFEKLERKPGKNWSHYWEAKHALEGAVKEVAGIVQMFGGLLLIGGEA